LLSLSADFLFDPFFPFGEIRHFELFLTYLCFMFTELSERVSEVFGQDVPDVGDINVRREGQRHGQAEVIRQQSALVAV
jgi:hypothetical protein